MKGSKVAMLMSRPKVLVLVKVRRLLAMGGALRLMLLWVIKMQSKTIETVRCDKREREREMPHLECSGRFWLM
jgi:hypothetical protein